MMNKHLLRQTPMSRRGALAALGIGAAGAALAACSSSTTAPSQTSRAVEYWLWDADQLPAYQACANAFEEATGIHVNITQIAWDDYWTKLTAGFIAGVGPDAFADHVSKFAQFVDLDVLVPLEEQAAWAGVDESAFQEGLIDLWKGEDGHQYGCPKDWDTEAMFYNKDMVAEAGLTDRDMASLEWNPEDGGTFERALARLTVDVNGVRGDEPGFDKDHIAVYGIGIQDGGAGDGQTQWSPFAATVGDWSYMDTTTWGTCYRYDDPDFQRVIDWYFGLVDKGYMNPYGAFSSTTSTDAMLGSGSIALTCQGDWKLNAFAKLDISVGITPTPIGPNGTSASMFNGLADSVAKQSDNIENAAAWVTWLGSAEAQDIVASYGVVFPAVASSTDKAVKVLEETGLSTSAFTGHVERRSTFFFPLSFFGADITAIMTPAMEDVYSNRVPASALSRANEQINLLFETSTRE